MWFLGRDTTTQFTSCPACTLEQPVQEAIDSWWARCKNDPQVGLTPELASAYMDEWTPAPARDVMSPGVPMSPPSPAGQAPPGTGAPPPATAATSAGAASPLGADGAEEPADPGAHYGGPRGDAQEDGSAAGGLRTEIEILRRLLCVQGGQLRDTLAEVAALKERVAELEVVLAGLESGRREDFPEGPPGSAPRGTSMYPRCTGVAIIRSGG